jgi:hypothetical protein
MTTLLDTEDLGLLYGAEIMATAGNTARKAGALNQPLHQVLACGPARAAAGYSPDPVSVRCKTGPAECD